MLRLLAGEGGGRRQRGRGVAALGDSGSPSRPDKTRGPAPISHEIPAPASPRHPRTRVRATTSRSTSRAPPPPQLLQRARPRASPSRRSLPSAALRPAAADPPRRHRCSQTSGTAATAAAACGRRPPPPLQTTTSAEHRSLMSCLVTTRKTTTTTAAMRWSCREWGRTTAGRRLTLPLHSYASSQQLKPTGAAACRCGCLVGR